jgi:hypothetical protein
LPESLCLPRLILQLAAHLACHRVRLSACPPHRIDLDGAAPSAVEWDALRRTAL